MAVIERGRKLRAGDLCLVNFDNTWQLWRCRQHAGGQPPYVLFYGGDFGIRFHLRDIEGVLVDLVFSDVNRDALEVGKLSVDLLPVDQDVAS